MNQDLPVTITFVPPPNTTVIQFVFMAVQKPPDLLKAVEPIATLYVMPFPGITGRNRFNPVKSK